MPDEVSDLPDSSTSQIEEEMILVSSFQICSCHHPNYSQPHLVVTASTIPLRHENAIAISYAIGDFDRAKHVIGHNADDKNKPIRLELGGEWNIPDFITWLATITTDNTVVWLDQLSIVQEDENIRRELQRIPKIFRTLEVIALLPNKPCNCLKDRFSQYEDGVQERKTRRGDFNLVNVLTECPYAIAVSSYHFRLWTMVEFSHARAISFRFCSGTNGRCFLTWSEEGLTTEQRQNRYLNPYLKWLWKHCDTVASFYGDNSPSNDMVDHIWSLIQDHASKVGDVLRECVHSFHIKAGFERYPDHLNREVAEFLLGKPLTRQPSEVEDVMLFGDYENQKATEEKDYVLSTFPGFGDYQIPKTWKSMDLPAIADDAFSQCETRLHEHWLSLLPQGLFRFSPGSSRCRPSLYIQSAKVKSYASIYGCLSPTTLLDVTGLGSLMVHLFQHQREASYRSRLLRSETYESAFGQSSINEVLNFMRRVTRLDSFYMGPTNLAFDFWAEKIVSQAPTAFKSWPTAEMGRAVFSKLMHKENDWGDLPEIDHHDACYRLLCSWAYIDPSVARDQGLGLVIARDDPPCIGLFNRAVYTGLRQIESHRARRRELGQDPDPPPDERTRDNFLFADDWLSVLLDPYKIRYVRKDNVYELLKGVDGAKIPKPYWVNEPNPIDKRGPMFLYGVVGVWFHTDTDDASIGGQYTKYWNERDAFIM